MKNIDAKTNCLLCRWRAMHHRCKSKRGNYGKLGISVCDDWSGENGFENFKQWSLLNNFSRERVLDRIDTYGTNAPDNCRWVSQKENNRNKTTTIFIDDENSRIPLSLYCEKNNLTQKDYMRLYMQIRRREKTGDAALSAVNEKSY